MIPFLWFIAVLCDWVQREQDDVIEFLREENRVLKAQSHGRRLHLSDHERRRRAAIGHRLGRRPVAGGNVPVSTQTSGRWSRMATENATWGYTRIQGALKNLGYHVGRSLDCSHPQGTRLRNATHKPAVVWRWGSARMT